MQANITHSVALYLDSVSFSLFEKYSTRCQTLPCCCYKLALTAVPDASNLTHTGNLASYSLRIGVDTKASLSASKAAYYSAPNLSDFFLHKISVRGAETLANP